MSKNLFRKGLAISAAAALSLTGVVALSAPASANGIFVQNYVTLLPTTGTEYRVLADDTFDLKSNVVSSLAGTAAKDLKFYISDPAKLTKVDQSQVSTAAATVTSLTSANVSSNTLTVTKAGAFADGSKYILRSFSEAGALVYNGVVVTGQVSTDTATASLTTADATPATTGGVAEITTNMNSRDAIRLSALGAPLTTATIASSIGGTATTDGRLANGDYVVNSETNSNANDRLLRIVNTDPTKTTTVTVTAWVDDNDNGAIDPSEYVSETRTVSFHINSDLTATTTLDQPVLGSTTIAATVAITPELNGQQVGNTDVTATFTAQSTNAMQTVTSTYNTTTKVWDVVGDLNGADVVIAGNYTARASVNAAAIGNTSTAVAAVAVSVDTEIEVSGTNDTTYAYNDSASDTTTTKVRPTKSAKLVITAYGTGGAATGKNVGAGKSVRVTFTQAAAQPAWTANGVTVIAAAATSATKDYVTDANGQVVLELKSSAAANGNSITVLASPEGLTGAAAADMVVTYETAVFEITDVNNAADDSDARTMGAGDTYTYTLLAADQYGAPLTGDYRIQLSTTGRAVTGGNFALTNGIATIPVTDAALGSGSTIVATFALQKNTAGTWAASSDATAFGTSTITINTTTTALLPAVTYVGGASPATLSPKAIPAYHVENFQGDFTSPAGTVVANLALTGTGLANGESATVSGSDLFFAYSDGSTIVRIVKDSMTFVVDDIANDEILVFANVTAKDKVVTLTSRGRTGTAKVTFSAAAETAGKAITSSSPKSIKGGRTLAVTFNLKDVFGNPVNGGDTDSGVSEIALSYDGPGFVTTDLDSVTELGTDGSYTVRVLLSAGDTGIGSFSLSYDPSGDDLTSTDVLTKSVAVWVGPIANAKAGAKKGRVIVEAYRAKGKTVNVFVGSTRVASFVADKANDSMVVRGIKSGTRNVRVTLSGPGEDFRGVITVK